MTTLVTIRTYSDCLEAVVAKSFLEAHGIYSIIPDWNTARNAWHYVTALQGVRLCAMESEAKRANEILDEVEVETLRQGPICKGDLFLAAIAFFLAGIPHPVRRQKLRS